MQLISQDYYSLVITSDRVAHELESIIRERYPDAGAGVWRQEDNSLRIQFNWGYRHIIYDLLEEIEA